ncbi:MAG: hypothetical protein HYZ24_04340 [Chloroflexi bacterium]|nr:hypothetical protein [Chloroflexota bacterium]
MQPQPELSLIEERGLILPAQATLEAEYLFTHALTQEVAYASLLRADRKLIHRVVAESIESAYPHRLGEFAGALAYHFELADEDHKTVTYLLLAAENALKQFALTSALPLFEKSAQIARKNQWDEELSRACGGLAEIHRLQGNSEAAIALFDEAVGYSSSAKMRGFYLTQKGFTQHLNMYAFKAAWQSYQAAEAEFEKESDPAKLGRLYTHMGYFHAVMPAPEDKQIGLEYFERARILLEKTKSYNDLAFAYAYLALTYSISVPEKGLDWGKRAIALCQKYGLSEPGEPAAIALGHSCKLAFNFDHAIRYYHMALEYNRATNYAFGRAIIQSSLAAVLLGAGKFAEALQSLEDSEIHWRKLNHHNALVSIKPMRYIALTELGETASAQRELNEALQADTKHHPYIWLEMIETYTLMGRFESALEILKIRSAELTPRQIQYLKTDPIFVRLREHKDFPADLPERDL